MAKNYANPPEMTIDQSKAHTAHFVTGKGEFDIQLFADKAPVTVNNFVFLTNDGFYDGLNFHRVIADFMIQGGCPDGSGSGGPGYKWNDEPAALLLKHDGPGVLSMANAGPNTNGAQFFITHKNTDWLNGKHAVFGKVVGDGMDVVNAIRQGDKIKSISIKVG